MDQPVAYQDFNAEGVCPSCQGAEFHFSSSLTETPCIFCILYLLKECQQQPEVREQLVRRLKEHIPDLDIEFVIPQICQLLLTWPYDDAQSLIAAVTSRAGACMHLAIKIMWWLEAASYYLSKEAGDRAADIMDNIEMAVVNGPVDTSLLGRSRSHSMASSIAHSHAAAVAAAAASSAETASAAADTDRPSAGSGAGVGDTSISLVWPPGHRDAPAVTGTAASASAGASAPDGAESTVEAAPLYPPGLPPPHPNSHPIVSGHAPHVHVPHSESFASGSPRLVGRYRARSHSSAAAGEGGLNDSFTAGGAAAAATAAGLSGSSLTRSGSLLASTSAGAGAVHFGLGTAADTEAAPFASISDAAAMVPVRLDSVLHSLLQRQAAPVHTAEADALNAFDDSVVSATTLPPVSAAAAAQVTAVPSSPVLGPGAEAHSHGHGHGGLRDQLRKLRLDASSIAEGVAAAPAASTAAAAAGAGSSSRAVVTTDGSAVGVGSSLTDAEFEVFISKQVRSQFFTAQLAFFKALHELSARLVQHKDRPARKALLPRLLSGLRPFGLYFPMFSAEDPHHLIRRIFPREAIVLNSRDKAPFLLWVEIETMPGVCMGDPAIYTGFERVVQAKLRRRAPSLLATVRGAAGSPFVGPAAAGADAAAGVGAALSGSGPSHGGDDDHDDDGAGDDFNSGSGDLSGGDTHAAAAAAAAAEEPLGRMPGAPVRAESVIIDDYVGSGQYQQQQQQLQHVGAAGGVKADLADLGSRNPSPTAVATKSAASPAAAAVATLPPLTGAAAWAEVRPGGRYDPFGESIDERTRRLLGHYLDEDGDGAEAGSGGAGGAKRCSSGIPAPVGEVALLTTIFKGGDDCRQEVLAMQLIQQFAQVWQQANLPLALRPYSVLVTSWDSGLVETVPNTCSIDGIKKAYPDFVSLEHFFECYFGPRHGERFEAARECFTQSMAAYSLVCYFLQVKDRHNGNILIDSNGHIVHIDFGFMLSSSPGGNMNFENVPFKLTEEYVRVMDGELSDTFNTFRMLFIRGFLEARRHAHKFVLLAEMLLDANINAFVRGRAAVDAFRARFCLELSEDACVEHAMTLIERSCNHWRSERYDEYQRVTNGIL